MFDLLSKNKKAPYSNISFFYPFFYGFLWGGTEATLGHLLHLSPVPGLAGFIMFPVGMVFMVRAWLGTGNTSSIFLAATTAAAVKIFDIFLPGPGFFAAANPALAILCEGLVVAGLFSFVPSVKKFNPFSLLSVSLSWRLIYSGLMAVAAFLTAAPNFFMLGPSILFKYLILESFINTLILFVTLKPFQLVINPVFFPERSAS